MSGDMVNPNGGTTDATDALLMQAAQADARARSVLARSIDYAFTTGAARIDERTLAALDALLRAVVAMIADGMRDHAARMLDSRGQGDAAAALMNVDADAIYARLCTAGVFRDPGFFGEVIARIRLDQIGAAIRVEAPEDPDQASALARLSESTDRVIAAAAVAAMAADARRRDGTGALAGTDLPTAHHARLSWWVAAALRAEVANGDAAALDRALTGAATRVIAAYDESDRAEGAAMRLAAGIDARSDELPMLAVEAIGDGRLMLFAAMLAHRMEVSFETVRGLLLDTDDTRLWLVLRVLEFPRDAIARIGAALCEADPGRDVEAFADRLDHITAIAPHVAGDAIASLRLHPDFREAILDLGHGDRA